MPTQIGKNPTKKGTGEAIEISHDEAVAQHVIRGHASLS
jgi:hypothetical protein